MKLAAWLLVGVLAFAGCGPAEEASPVVRAPQQIDTAECAVCGMTVRDQAAPRGQVVHRDGQHKHLCSLGDLRAYLQTPSPLGAPSEVWVEDLGAFEPATESMEPHPWLAADDAVYVVGVPRTGIMGKPILSFSKESDAAASLAEEGARTTTWAALRSTPFHELPTAQHTPRTP